MSAENMAVVRGMLEDVRRGDIPSVLAALDPEIEWIESDHEFMPHRQLPRHRRLAAGTRSVGRYTPCSS
jgi:hypothetical protein